MPPRLSNSHFRGEGGYHNTLFFILAHPDAFSLSSFVLRPSFFERKTRGPLQKGSTSLYNSKKTVVVCGRAGWRAGGGMHEPIVNRLDIVQGNQSDYFALARYHYEPLLTFPPTKVFKAVGNTQYAAHFPDPVAVLVFIQPFPDIAARNKATAGFFTQHESNADNLRLLNSYVLYCARLITDPRYLRKGIATYLLKETLSRLQIPIVETLTPIDFTNRIYTNAGFEIYYTPAPQKYVRLMQAYENIGLDVHDTTCHQLIDMRIEHLPPNRRLWIEKEIALFLSGFRNADRFTPSPARTKFILSKVPPPQAYLIWFNPNAPLAKTVLLHREQMC